MNYLAIWKNPVFIRFCRSELRLRKAIFWYLLTFMATAFAVMVVYVPAVMQDMERYSAARKALLPVLVIQGIIMLFLATGSVASGITREKVDDILNYQRLTPLPTAQKILGYLFGLPVREYVMFAITLPFLAFVLIVGKVPFTAFAPYFIIFCLSSLLYHFTGMAAGMISRKWRLSARISQGMIILLYFVLPQLSAIGLVFLEFLTVRPSFREHILPVIMGSLETDAGAAEAGAAAVLTGTLVPFFNLSISGTTFSILIQSLLIILFFKMVARKWRGDNTPCLGKFMAITTFAVFCLISLANIWPNLVRSENAIAILQYDSAEINSAAIAAFPLILAFTSCLLAFILMIPAVPDPMSWRHGQVRAQRTGKSRLGPWEDDASGYQLVAAMVAIQAAFIIAIFALLHVGGYFAAATVSPSAGTFLILATAIWLLYFHGLKETLGGSQIGLVLLLHWVLPLLVAIIVFASGPAKFSNLAIFISSISPVTILPLSATELLPADMLKDYAAITQRSLGLAFISLTAVTIFLQLRLRKSRQV